MHRRTLVLLTFLAAPLAACGTVHEAINGPQLSPMGYPAAIVPQQPSVVLQDARTAPTTSTPNSLWRNGARTFFMDQRASKVGDILTVLIEIDDSAATSNASTSSRQSGASLGIPNFLGLESSIGKILPSPVDPSKLINSNSNSSNAGSGAVVRQEKINTTIAAVITQVLPNGNLVISGSQEVKTNNELRELTVDGIIRPEDITSSNTIKHTQIASARIKYGGRGDQSQVQKTPVGQSLVERLSPF
ncbi:MAG: flagellar basal body L-ring protein FlgH [Alphaproteobacteria bacterium]